MNPKLYNMNYNKVSMITEKLTPVSPILLTAWLESQTQAARGFFSDPLSTIPEELSSIVVGVTQNRHDRIYEIEAIYSKVKNGHLVFTNLGVVIRFELHPKNGYTHVIGGLRADIPGISDYFDSLWTKIPEWQVGADKAGMAGGDSALPKRPKVLAKWKDAYSIIVKTKRSYLKSYHDFGGDDPTPKMQDYIDALKSKGISYSGRQIRSIIEAGNAGKLKK